MAFTVTASSDQTGRSRSTATSDANAVELKDALQALQPITDEEGNEITVVPEEHFLIWLRQAAHRLIREHKRRKKVAEVTGADIFGDVT